MPHLASVVVNGEKTIAAADLETLVSYDLNTDAEETEE